MLYLDLNLTQLSIVPIDNPNDSSGVFISVERIQVICAATTFLPFLLQVEAMLEGPEKDRAVLLQYTTEQGESVHLCFLEDSERSRDRCIQELRVLWLDKRNMEECAS